MSNPPTTTATAPLVHPPASRDPASAIASFGGYHVHIFAASPYLYRGGLLVGYVPDLPREVTSLARVRRVLELAGDFCRKAESLWDA